MKCRRNMPRINGISFRATYHQKSLFGYQAVKYGALNRINIERN